MAQLDHRISRLEADVQSRVTKPCIACCVARYLEADREVSCTHASIGPIAETIRAHQARPEPDRRGAA